MSTASTTFDDPVFDEPATPMWVDEEQRGATRWIRRYDHESELGAWVRVAVLHDGGRREVLVRILELVSSPVSE